MITPRFSCSQTEGEIIVSIYCPSIRASEVEIHVDETTFIAHVNPYFLRLNFSHPVAEDDESAAKYDPSSGYLTVTLTKAVKGQEFRDLDLLAKLLAPRPTKQTPQIEVISSDTVDDDLAEKAESLSLEDRVILKAAENDWQLPQTVPESDPPLKLGPDVQYGFLDMYTGYFRNVGHTENEVNELGGDAERILPAQRRTLRREHENKKWDEEHYMADFVDDDYVQDLITWRHPYAEDTKPFEFTEDENATMLRLPRKEYMSTPVQDHNLYLTLISVLFSYAYESRTTQGDPGPESAWTVCNLTPAFSALDSAPYHDEESLDTSRYSESVLQATFCESYRRSLAFPLFRSFALAEACRRDVSDWLIKGKRVVFRCLLNVKRILDLHEVYYVYSKVWVDDFCVWVQSSASEDILLQLGKQVKELTVSKSIIGWDLEELEKAIYAAQEREADSDDESSDGESSDNESD